MATDGGQGHGGGHYRRLEGVEKVAVLVIRSRFQRSLFCSFVTGLFRRPSDVGAKKDQFLRPRLISPSRWGFWKRFPNGSRHPPTAGGLLCMNFRELPCVGVTIGALAEFIHAVWPVVAVLFMVAVCWAMYRYLFTRTCWNCGAQLRSGRRRKKSIFVRCAQCDSRCIRIIG